MTAGLWLERTGTLLSSPRRVDGNEIWALVVQEGDNLTFPRLHYQNVTSHLLQVYDFEERQAYH